MIFQAHNKNEEEKDLASKGDVRQLLALFPFTNNGTSTTDAMSGGSIGLSQLSSYVLAIRHFNSKNPTVVRELVNYSSCDVELNESSPVMDTRMMAADSVSALLRQAYNHQVPDAVIGGCGEFPGVDLSVVSSGLKIPYMTYGVSNLRVASPFFYPYTTRLSADANALAERATSFLWTKGRTNYTAVLQVRSETASQINEALIYSLTRRGVSYVSKVYESPRFGGAEEDLEIAMRVLCEIGYNTIVLIVEDAEQELPVIAQIASQDEFLGGQVFWFFMGNIDMHMLSADWVTQNQAVIDLLSGSALIKEIDRFMYSPSDDLFLRTWREQSASMVDAVNGLIPSQSHCPADCPAEHIPAQIDYFKTHDPAFGAGLIYDSVMALGMGLCDAKSRGEKESLDHVHNIQSTHFVGASGPVRFGDDGLSCSGGRSSDSLTFGGFNLFPHGNTTLPYVLTDVYASNATKWSFIAPFHFFGGSTTAPNSLRRSGEQNYLSEGVRNFGLALWGFDVSLCFAACLWVVMNRRHRVVRAHQPLFLQLIVFGAILLSVPIFLNSWDESYGWASEQLKWACTAVPWFFIIGHLFVYSSLASKLWRINKVLQFRRNTVTVQQVLWPSLVLIILAFAVLTAWTFVDGFDWVRVEIDSGTAESIAKCQGEHTALFFTPIFGLIMVPTLVTLAMAVRTRDIDPTLSESKWILTLILVQFQVLFVSIPVLKVLDEMSTDGKYFGHILLYFTFSVSPILLIICPKVVAVHRANLGKPELPEKTRGSTEGGQVHVSGLAFLPIPEPKNPRRDSATVQETMD